MTRTPTPGEPPAIALDIGTRYARIAAARPGVGGLPRPVRLPGDVPGEGLALTAAVRGRPVEALLQAYAAYRAQCGTPAAAVVVLPRRAARELAGPVTAALADAGCPRPRALGAAHALLALVRYAGLGRDGDAFLVCDAGARAADAARCALTATGVLPHAAAAEAGPDGSLGAALDEALLAAAGLPGGEGPTDQHPDAYAELAAARADDPGGRRLGLAVARAVRDPDLFDGTPVHQVAGREIPAGAVRRALPPLREAVRRALDRVTERGGAAEGPPPLLLAGGLARLEPLRRELADRHALLPLPEEVDPGHAAAVGGALVAAGLADAGDRYPYAVRIATHRRAGGQLRDGALELSGPGTLEPGGGAVFAEHRGRPAEVRPEPAAGRPLRVEAVAPDGRAVALADVTLPAGTPEDRCRVGLDLAPDGSASLVLRPAVPDAVTAVETRVPLGPLPVLPET